MSPPTTRRSWVSAESPPELVAFGPEVEVDPGNRAAEAVVVVEARAVVDVVGAFVVVVFDGLVVVVDFLVVVVATAPAVAAKPESTTISAAAKAAIGSTRRRVRMGLTTLVPLTDLGSARCPG